MLTGDALTTVVVAAGLAAAGLLSGLVQRASRWPERRRMRFALALVVGLGAAAWTSTEVSGAAHLGLITFIWSFVLVQVALLWRRRPRAPLHPDSTDRPTEAAALTVPRPRAASTELARAEPQQSRLRAGVR